MTVAVLDASAVIAFLKGEAPELLEKIAQGVLVSEVTFKTLEWKLTRAGIKRKEVQADLRRLNFEVIEFNERLNPRIDLVLEHVKGLEFETLVAAGLAQGKLPQGEATFFTAEIAWVNRSVPGLNVQLVGRALKDSSSPSTQKAAKKLEDSTQPSLLTSSQGSFSPQGSMPNVQANAAPSVIVGD